MTGTDWTTETLAALERDGYRSGGARRAVIVLLGQQDCCLSAQAIFDRLRAEGRTVGIASVYRILELLVARGLVQRVEIGDNVTRFEAAHAGGDHHHHLVCSDCGKVEAFADERLERALRAIEEKTGYAGAGHDVLLRGECDECRTSA
jgi:Fur family transcriptional regulator, ferric uptake regulator